MSAIDWTLIGLGSLALCFGGIWLRVQLRLSSRIAENPRLTRMAMDRMYQKRLKRSGHLSAERIDVDFVFTAPSLQAAEGLAESVRGAGFEAKAVSDAPDQYGVEARRSFGASKLDFAVIRDVLGPLAERCGGDYVGPGEKALKLMGIDVRAGDV